jgi:hypothetical protein
MREFSHSSHAGFDNPLRLSDALIRPRSCRCDRCYCKRERLLNQPVCSHCFLENHDNPQDLLPGPPKPQELYL